MNAADGGFPLAELGILSIQTNLSFSARLIETVEDSFDRFEYPLCSFGRRRRRRRIVRYSVELLRRRNLSLAKPWRCSDSKPTQC